VLVIEVGELRELSEQEMVEGLPKEVFMGQIGSRSGGQMWRRY
jgi:hypothetical protein